jgi:hypothetical protein
MVLEGTDILQIELLRRATSVIGGLPSRGWGEAPQLWRTKNNTHAATPGTHRRSGLGDAQQLSLHSGTLGEPWRSDAPSHTTPLPASRGFSTPNIAAASDRPSSRAPATGAGLQAASNPSRSRPVGHSRAAEPCLPLPASDPTDSLIVGRRFSSIPPR